jgi:hypothetical protein
VVEPQDRQPALAGYWPDGNVEMANLSPSGDGLSPEGDRLVTTWTCTAHDGAVEPTFMDLDVDVDAETQAETQVSSPAN